MRFSSSNVSLLMITMIESLAGVAADDFLRHLQDSTVNNVHAYDNIKDYTTSFLLNRTLTVTGCSNLQNNEMDTTATSSSSSSSDGNTKITSYVTYRICDNYGDNDDDDDTIVCNEQTKNGEGCNANNGDFITTMKEFALNYEQYITETSTVGGFLFDCIRSDQFANQYYQMMIMELQEAMDPPSSLSIQQETNNQQQAQQYYVGPMCSSNGSSEIVSGLFLDEDCTVQPTNAKTPLSSILGFQPNHNPIINSCNLCITNQDNENNLCETLLKSSGRCDRKGQTEQGSEMDLFWKMLVQSTSAHIEQDDVAGGEELDYDEYQQQANYETATNYTLMNFDNYNGMDTCDLIDKVTQDDGLWQSIRSTAEGLDGIFWIAAIMATSLMLLYAKYGAGMTNRSSLSKELLMDLEGATGFS